MIFCALLLFYLLLNNSLSLICILILILIQSNKSYTVNLHNYSTL